MIRRTAIFTLLHIAVLLVCMYVFLSMKMDRAITEEDIQSRSESAMELAVKVLSMPGRLVRSAWPGQIAPGVLEWVLFIGNSLLWGIILAFAYTKVRNAI